MRRLAPFLVLSFATGCATPFPAYELSHDRADTLSDRFPKQPVGTRIVLRAILGFRGMELPMTFRIWRMLPDSYRLIVMDDLGGAILHVVHRGSELTVVARADLLPERFVAALDRDLATWLFAAFEPTDRIVSLADATPALLRADAAGVTLFQATGNGKPIDRIHIGTDGHLSSSIRLDWGDRDSEAARLRRLVIRSDEFGYTVDLEVREWQPADLTASKFKTSR